MLLGLIIEEITWIVKKKVLFYKTYKNVLTEGIMRVSIARKGSPPGHHYQCSFSKRLVHSIQEGCHLFSTSHEQQS